MAERTTVDAPARRPARVRDTLETMVRQRWLYLLLAPAIVAVFVFSYLPIYGLTLAFRDFNAALDPFASPWSKPIFYNFWFFQDPEFWYVLRNTVRISVVKFVFGWPAPIILALLLNEIRHSGFKRTVQTVSYLPHFLSWVIMAAVTYRILDYEAHSPVNVIIGLFGAEPVALMADEKAFIPIVSILLVLAIPGILQAGFDQLYNLMNLSTRRIAYVTDIYVLRLGLVQGQYSAATAIGLLYSVLGLALVLIANRISKSSYGQTSITPGRACQETGRLSCASSCLVAGRR